MWSDREPPRTGSGLGMKTKEQTSCPNTLPRVTTDYWGQGTVDGGVYSCWTTSNKPVTCFRGTTSTVGCCWVGGSSTNPSGRSRNGKTSLSTVGKEGTTSYLLLWSFEKSLDPSSLRFLDRKALSTHKQPRFPHVLFSGKLVHTPHGP